VIYRQFLIMRKALLWYFWIIVAVGAIFLANIALRQTLMCGHNTTVSGWLLSSAAAGAIVFAAIYGVGLGNASREGARVFWVLPQGRWRSGLALICADCVGTIVALAITFIGSVLVMTAGIAVQHTSCVVTNDLSAQNIAVAVGFPLAVYGWCTLTGMLLRRVAYMGLIFLPVGLLWLALSQADNALGDFLRAIAFANPFNMFKDMAALPLWGIAIVTLALALALWQRADVIA
jgi:hypothetical protein